MADDDVLLEKIANHYLFYGSFHSDLGLYNGKMGMVIFFFAEFNLQMQQNSD